MKNKKTQIEKEHKKDRKKRMIPKRKLQNGLKLQNNRQEIRLDLQALSVKESNYLAIRIVLTFLASVSVLFCCFSAFQVKVSLIVTAVPALVMAVISQILFLRKKSGWIGGTGMAIVIAVLSVILLNSVSNGFSAIANDVLRSVNKNMAMANLMFVVNEDSLAADEYIASIILSLLVTFVFAILIRFHLNAWVVVLQFLLCASGFMYKCIPSVWTLVLAGVTMVGILLAGNIKGRITKDMYAGMLVFAGVLAGAACLIFILLTYIPIPVVDDIKDSIVYNGGNLIYGKNDYPEGSFKRFHTVETNGSKKLHIEMSEPAVMYLRGYVGSKYTEDGWTENDKDIYGGDYEGVFEYFAKFNYYPLATLASYMDITKINDADMPLSDIISVEVENLAASSKYQYLPENMTYDSLPDLYAPKKDVNFVAQGFGNRKPYRFYMDTLSKNDYESIYNESWYTEGTGDTDFIDCEQTYAYFASQNYTEVSDEMKQYFDRTLPEAGKKLNPFDAIDVVRHYLRDTITYSEDVTANDPGTDFVEDLIENKKEGYSVHFATAAAMMFRYYNIPARYVEGYLVAPEEGETSIDVLDQDAHAWVEIYVNGLGFIPVEVTPGFYSEDDNSTIGNGAVSGSDNQDSESEDSSSDQDNNDNDDSTEIDLLYILIAIVSLLVLFLIVVIVRRAVICSKRKKAMKSENREKAVAAASLYIEALYKYAGKKMEESLPSEVITVLQKNRFSREELDYTDVAVVRDYAQTVKQEVYHSSNLWGRCRMRFVKCLI